MTKIIRRDYSGAKDQPAMIALAQLARAQTLHVTDLPYRLSSWALDEPSNASLWMDQDGRIVAWAVMQTPFWTIDYVIHPEFETELHPLILAWAEGRAYSSLGTIYGVPSWYVNIFTDRTDRLKLLEQHGYVSQAEVGEDSWSKVWMKLDGRSIIPSYPLPVGFSIRPLAGETEVDAYVDLHQSTFGTKNMTSGWRKRTLLQPAYTPGLDLVAQAPNGRLVAFCIGWISPGINGELVGQIEPLGCHADFRKYALGRLVLCEALHRLQERGAATIFVETDNYRDTALRLYESIGFQVFREVLVYRKDYNDSHR